MTQESFFRSYHARGTALAYQRIFGWNELERAAGIPIQPLFERFSGFIHLFSEVDRIVISWVRQFYAVVWIHPEYDFIAFMLNGWPERMSYNRLQQLLGVDTLDRKLHQIVYRASQGFSNAHLSQLQVLMRQVIHLLCPLRSRCKLPWGHIQSLPGLLQ